MIEIFGWIASISLLIGYFSFMCMADYLFRRGEIKHRLFGIRPDIIFKQYYKITKNEKGKIGIWFWVTILSALLCIIAALIEGFIIIFIEKNLSM